MIIPFVLFDISLEMYHQIGFRLLGMPLVDRNKYIRIDRFKLDYLTSIEKLNCVYCGYGNGLLHYASVIVARTELHWCGIKHDSQGDFISPNHHKIFLPYNDKRAFDNFINKSS